MWKEEAGVWKEEAEARSGFQHESCKCSRSQVLSPEPKEEPRMLLARRSAALGAGCGCPPHPPVVPPGP